MSKTKSRSLHPCLVFSDSKGRVFSHPSLKMVGRSGDQYVLPSPTELVRLPKGSQLFSLPGRVPVGWEEEQGTFLLSDQVRMKGSAVDCVAVAAFLPPGYVRTVLPASVKKGEGPVLPLWAYSAVGWQGGEFWTTGLLIDPDPHWNPKYFQNDYDLRKRVERALRKHRANRLLKQLSKCALEYHCFAAKNVFFRRWECPLPTSPSCNADCLGCISLQPSECCPASQERIRFVPTLDEVIEIALPHLEVAEDAIVSFGQGCEGEPLTEWQLLERVIRRLRERTARGTINLNTNGSYPSRVKKLCEAGLDSIRITLNSARREFYLRYHRPRGYSFDDVVESIHIAKSKGVYTSINLLVFPGFTDREEEVEALIKLIRATHLDLLQMRNLNIDPDLYLEAMGQGAGIGISKMVDILKRELPSLHFGYFNRTKANFYRSPLQESSPSGRSSVEKLHDFLPLGLARRSVSRRDRS